MSVVAEIKMALTVAWSTGFGSALGATQQVIDPDATFLPVTVVVALGCASILATIKIVRTVERFAARLDRIEEQLKK